MGGTRDKHRPLLSGIQIKSGTGRHSVRSVGAGTLTGLATRNSDGRKVLVTNLHVMAGRDDNDDYRNPSGNEEMYQGLRNPSDKVGSNLDWEPLSSAGDNYVDVAMCELEDDVEAEFTLHDAPEHSDRTIIAGAMNPTTGMELTLLGASTGEKTATVTHINREGEFGGVEFAGLIRLRSSRPLLEGDSGSPCLYRVREGVYKMVGILFGINLLDSQVGWAFPASAAERALDITFGVPKKEQLIDGIDLASKHLLRSTGPSLKPDSSTGAIEEDWGTVVAGQSVGDAPIVCVVPTTGTITKGTAVTDAKGVTYTPVRLSGGLSAYKYFQPNNDHYASIVDSSPTHDRTGSPKTTTGGARIKFIDRDRPAGSQEIMELEVRKITRWGAPLSAPEFEYQAKVNDYGAGFGSARAVFLPDRLIENRAWTTIWRSGSSLADLGPDFPQRAAAVGGISPFTMLMSRVGAMISSVPGLASRAVGEFFKKSLMGT